MSRFTRLSASDRRIMLIEAAAACMADHGISGFTVDRICARAQVSRGLITHHFGSMAGMMAATYAALYEEHLAMTEPGGPDAQSLARFFDHVFAPERFNRPRINTWLALWSAIACSPELTEEHRRRYGDYRAQVTGYLQAAGAQDAEALAQALISLLDGLALQHCVDPVSMPAGQARSTCETFLAPHLAAAAVQQPVALSRSA